jgi:hypothetical protein
VSPVVVLVPEHPCPGTREATVPDTVKMRVHWPPKIGSVTWLAPGPAVIGSEMGPTDDVGLQLEVWVPFAVQVPTNPLGPPLDDPELLPLLPPDELEPLLLPDELPLLDPLPPPPEPLPLPELPLPELPSVPPSRSLIPTICAHPPNANSAAAPIPPRTATNPIDDRDSRVFIRTSPGA